AAAGEMTQLCPDQSLGTSYRLGTWGIYNDPGEDNKTEFVITATTDGTSVTITPAVTPVGSADASPFTVELNRGECYIVKADANASPPETSLSGSFLTATKPVSVISGLTCGYVPLGGEACNELLNAPLPAQYVDTVFYTAPFSDFTGYGLLFVSDVKDYFAISANGLTYQSTNGIIAIPTTTDPQQFTTTAFAQCYELSVGSSITRDGLSDPSMVNVMPLSQWIDSLQWYLPDVIDPTFGNHYSNFVSVIYPTAAEPSILLDGAQITSFGASNVIAGSPYSSIVVQILPGSHSLTSPMPVYAFASEFSFADAYSYNVGAMVPTSTSWQVSLDSITSPRLCTDFAVALRLHTTATSHPTKIHCDLTYDPTFFTLLSIDRGAVATANNAVIKNTVPDISVDLSNLPEIVTGDTIIVAHFHCGVMSGATSMSLTYSIDNGPNCVESSNSQTTNFAIANISDSEHAAFALQIPPALPGNTTTGAFSLVGVPADPIKAVTVRLQYDHDVMLWRSFQGGAIVGSGYTATPITNLDPRTDQATITFSPEVMKAGELLKFLFDVYLAKADSSNVICSTDIVNDRPCPPLTILAEPIGSTFTVLDACGTKTMRAALDGVLPSIDKIVPNPTTGQVTISFNLPLAKTNYSVNIINVMGECVRVASGSVSDGAESLSPLDLSGLPNGSYFLEI
ncbi:MAG TPA: T9SS type A sorting domain-containing protein, partial [Steroidobacteraceae bacterium]|nr:T9SS type A sorting domain-containing protein [Steroidobacteraceae bacterium]